jgi:hypothetical protein
MQSVAVVVVVDARVRCFAEFFRWKYVRLVELFFLFLEVITFSFLRNKLIDMYPHVTVGRNIHAA